MQRLARLLASALALLMLIGPTAAGAADDYSPGRGVAVAINFIDNAQREVVGLAFGSPDSKRPEPGFEFRFRKLPTSHGYDSGAFGGEDYSVIDIALDITPVRMATPLYRPLVAGDAAGTAASASAAASAPKR